MMEDKPLTEGEPVMLPFVRQAFVDYCTQEKIDPTGHDGRMFRAGCNAVLTMLSKNENR
jgi:hypothetical protein